MQVLAILLVGAFVIGGTEPGRWICDRPLVLLALCVVAAASFYSMRVVL